LYLIVEAIFYVFAELLCVALGMIPEATVETVTHILSTEAGKQTSSDTMDDTKPGEREWEARPSETSASLWDRELDGV
jgi:hypothetical protein